MIRPRDFRLLPRICSAAALCGVVLAIQLAMPARAIADGCFVWRNRDVDIREPEQKALILFDQGIEDLVLEVRFAGTADDFGWIVPLPAEPQMSPDRPRLFEHLSMATQYSYFEGSRRGVLLSATGAMSRDVQELRRQRVGIFDTSILRADDSAALARWLERHDFHPRPGTARALAGYTNRGWTFVAMRIAPGTDSAAVSKGLREGSLQPIRFRFASKEPIFPLAVSSGLRDSSRILIYILEHDPVVNATCSRGRWEVHPHGDPHGWQRELDPQANFPGLADPHACLTKLRAVLAPQDMEDVRFASYDPFPDLKGGDERRRAEAATDLGRRKLPGAAEALVEFLHWKRDDAPDVRSAVWALGQIGSPLAVNTLVGVAHTGAELLRLEAIEALAVTRSRDALPVYLSGLEGADDAQPWPRFETYRACLDQVIEMGDATCLPTLRLLAQQAEAQRGDPVARDFKPTVVEGARVALAACGDPSAQDTVVAQLVREVCSATSPTALRGFAERDQGTINGFPKGLVAIIACQSRFGLQYLWAPRLTAYADLLSKKPPLNDQLMRRAANEPRMTDAGRCVLLAQLKQPEPRDLQALEAVWGRALTSGSTGLRARGVIYNNDACSAAYALARLKGADGLARMWTSYQGNDTTLRGELAEAMAQCRDRRLAGLVADYVVEAWRGYFSQPDSAWPTGPRGVYSLDRSEEIDRGYRTGIIKGFLAGESGDTLVMRRLITDHALPERFRFFWMMNGTLASTGSATLYPTALGELERIAASCGRPGGVSQDVADQAMELRRFLVKVKKNMAEEDLE